MLKLGAERTPDRDDEIPRLHAGGIPEDGCRQLRRLDLHHGHIGLRIGPNDAPPELAPVEEPHVELARILDDMMIGQDVSVRAHDHAGTEPLTVLLSPRDLRPSEEPAKEGIVEDVKPRAIRNLRLDRHHPFARRAHDRGQPLKERDVPTDGRPRGQIDGNPRRILPAGERRPIRARRDRRSSEHAEEHERDRPADPPEALAKSGADCPADRVHLSPS
ncbi:hypothetical protein HRbin10_02609 [bacterium HR10]|nr:hypothetical protein HRbin10_02609 [bacterium HR10]